MLADTPPGRKVTSFSMFTLMYMILLVQGPRICNDILLSVRNSLTISNYRQKLKNYFIPVNAMDTYV